MAEGAQGDDVRYTAFLSYSHQDAAAAGRLHRRLEAYRIPRRLAGTETVRGQVPSRLWPIFRDREELPAASDLSETVRAALAESGALIILCSPAAAGSLWVAEEIEVFRKLHPDRPILAAILDGDPPDCFPEALRAFGEDGTWHEPLATDLRPGRDGARLGLLKLVAGITGLGLDELVQRDAARRIRRVMAVTAAALVAMLVMAALAVVALQARREAERQRAEAEGQIEFMLTDLRDRLRGVGRIEIMQAVNARALVYYGGQPELGGLTDESLRRRARILHAIGEDYVTAGNVRAAFDIFQEAHRTTGEQLARSPDDPARLIEHGHSEYWIGRIHELNRDWAGAERQFRRFAAVTDRLIVIAPDNPDHMMEAGWSALDLGNVQLNGTRDYAGAQRSYERAIAWFEAALRARSDHPDAPRRLANAYGWLADSFYMRRMWRESLEARLRQHRLAERMHREDPANLDSNFRFALAQRAIGAGYLRLNNPDVARAPIFDAYARSARLTRSDPRNAEWLLFRGMMGCELYFGGIGLPPGLTRARVRTEVNEVAAALRAQSNPRVSDLSRCLEAMG